MFKLKDLMNDPVKGQFYREQLTKSPAPKNEDYFFVEKILGKKKAQGSHLLLSKIFVLSKQIQSARSSK